MAVKLLIQPKYTAEKVSVFGFILVHIFSAFSRIRTEYGKYLSVFSPNAGKMRTRITLHTESFYAVIKITPWITFMRYGEIDWSRLRNWFLKSRFEVNRINYIKQHNYCVSFLRKAKKQYYGNLTEKEVADKKNSGILKNHFFLKQKR